MVSLINPNILIERDAPLPAINLHIEEILEFTQRREQILEELEYLVGKKELGHLSESLFLDRAAPLLKEELVIYKQLRTFQEKHPLSDEEIEICSKATNLKACQERTTTKWHLRNLSLEIGQEFNLKMQRENSKNTILRAIASPLQAPQKAIANITLQCNTMKNAIDDSVHLFAQSGNYLYGHGKRTMIMSSMLSGTSFIAMQALNAANIKKSHYGSRESLGTEEMISTNAALCSIAAITVGSFLVSTTLIKGIQEPSLKYVKYSIPKAAKVITKASAVTIVGTAALLLGAPLYAAAGLAVGSSWAISALLG
jgi:hypothetical protein